MKANPLPTKMVVRHLKTTFEINFQILLKLNNKTNFSFVKQENAKNLSLKIV